MTMMTTITTTTAKTEPRRDGPHYFRRRFRGPVRLAIFCQQTIFRKKKTILQPRIHRQRINGYVSHQ